MNERRERLEERKAITENQQQQEYRLKGQMKG